MNSKKQIESYVLLNFYQIFIIRCKKQKVCFFQFEKQHNNKIIQIDFDLLR